MAQPLPTSIPDPEDDPGLTARIFMAVTPALLAEIDDYRFANRYKSQSAAIRKLLQLGLRAAAWEAKKK
jgi:Arc/MetJ-type ribon-helix-helix transcriptional regulator